MYIKVPRKLWKDILELVLWGMDTIEMEVGVGDDTYALADEFAKLGGFRVKRDSDRFPKLMRN